MRGRGLVTEMARATIKSPEEVVLMRECGWIVRDVIRLMREVIRPRITTKELDYIADEFIRSQGAEPAFKGYGADPNNLFPASLCTSIDDEVVHGIPSDRQLQEGEVISIDVGVKKNNFFGDGAWSFQVGTISEDKALLMKVTEESLYKGIEQAKAGNHVQDISAKVQSHVEASGFSVVRDLVGHGIGRSLHEEPSVPNFGEAGKGIILKAGMTLAIEPMVNLGSYRVQIDSDGWTIRTMDRLCSAHFEHTVLITENEPEILTI